MHCRGQHDLVSCPDLTMDKLEQILTQVMARDDTEAGGKNERVDGRLIHHSRKRRKNTRLKPNYLYVDTCTMDNIAINPAYLTNVYEVKEASNSIPTPVHKG